MATNAIVAAFESDAVPVPEHEHVRFADARPIVCFDRIETYQ
jgi:hypothetical protein